MTFIQQTGQKNLKFKNTMNEIKIQTQVIKIHRLQENCAQEEVYNIEYVNM